MANYSQNPQVPGVQSNVFVPDQLIASDFPLVTEGKATLVSGAGALKRGTVLGKITIGAAVSAAKAGGNTGTGTFVLDATTPVKAGAKAGVWTLRCITAVANGGEFELNDPDGISRGIFIIPAGAGNSVTVDDAIKGVLTDAGTDFIVGDGFDITVAAGSGKYKTAVATAVDGSAVPVGILVDDVDATAADKNCGIYLTGEFNSRAITFDVSFSVATLTPLLRPLGIFLKSSVSNAAPT